MKILHAMVFMASIKPFKNRDEESEEEDEEIDSA